MKQTYRFYLAVSFLAIFSFSISPRIASAYDASSISNRLIAKHSENSVEEETDTNSKHSQNTSDDVSKQIAKNSDKVSEKDEISHPQHNRFNANQIRKCEKKAEKISDKLDTISKRGTKQLDVFHTIATRVEGFYVQKGYVVEGYGPLVAELDSLYDQSLVAVTSTQNASDAWGCNVQDPIASLDNFKATKHTESATLKAYKDKVRQLILLVKQAGGTN